METRSRLCFLLLLSLLASLMIAPARGYDFYVGGRSGWVANPSESYGSWSGRMRFSVNDSLVFVYDKSVDSVLEVTSADYSSCNAASPITKLDTGRDSFKLTRSGPFYFITGNATHCQAGQKLLVVVLAIRSPPSSPTSPAPGSTPPPSAPAPGSTTAPAPGSTTSPAPASTTPPAPASTPASTPSLAPASSQSPAPSSGPAQAPSSASSPSPAPSSGPAQAPSSASSPSSPPTGGTASSPSSESAPGSTTTPGSSGSGSGSPPPPPARSTGTSLSVPTSLPAIVVAAALALLGGRILQ